MILERQQISFSQVKVIQTQKKRIKLQIEGIFIMINFKQLIPRLKIKSREIQTKETKYIFSQMIISKEVPFHKDKLNNNQIIRTIKIKANLTIHTKPFYF